MSGKPSCLHSSAVLQKCQNKFFWFFLWCEIISISMILDFLPFQSSLSKLSGKPSCLQSSAMLQKFQNKFFWFFFWFEVISKSRILNLLPFWSTLMSDHIWFLSEAPSIMMMISNSFMLTGITLISLWGSWSDHSRPCLSCCHLLEVCPH